MKQIKCIDVSGRACNYVTRAESEDEAVANLKAHLNEVHPDLTEDKSEEEQKQLEEKIHRMITEG